MKKKFNSEYPPLTLLKKVSAERPKAWEQMKQIAEFIAKTAFDYENTRDEVKSAVAELCGKFPLYE